MTKRMAVFGTAQSHFGEIFMAIARTALTATLALTLAACGGGGGNSSNISSGGTGNGSSGGTSTASTCSVSARQSWAFDVINEWYLFPDLIQSGVNQASYSNVQDYIDALVAPARAESKDRFFTYITSKSEEEALIASGSSAGFGIRLAYDTSANRVFILEAFESAPGFGAGMDRGTELLAIGTSASTLQTVSSLMASGGPQAVVNALGPSDAGVTRVLRFETADGNTVEQSIAKADFPLDPISDRYGVQILNDGGKQVGYINLRTFIVSDASNQLREAFEQFQAAGVTELILDFRYNGGGLVSVAEVMGDLMGRGNVGQVFSRTTLRASKASNNETALFGNEPFSIQPTKIAFIGRGGTASASELVANSMIPYLGNNTALIGAETFGKPVGQFGFDRDECDDRLRVVAFQTENADGNAEYFSGLSSAFPTTCRASDDLTKSFDDPTEDSIAKALDFLAGRSCAATISSGSLRSTQSVRPAREILQPERPSAVQHEIPGLY
jgi:C-terminal processing protease CtpA/Prc